MVSFEAPHYLRYAWVLPLLVAGYLLSRAATGRARRERGQPGQSQHWAYLRLLLSVLACATLVLALANPEPQTGSHATAVPAATRLVFVVDVSSSMLAADVLPDRLTQAQKVVDEVVRGLHGQEVSLVVFASSAQLYLPLTTDYAAVSQACLQLSPALVARQGTSLAEALLLAGQVVQARPKQGRVVCVLSDGESHTLGYERVADSLRRAGIDLFAIGIGTPEGNNILVSNPATGQSSEKADQQGQPIRSRLQEDKLKLLVQNRPGRYFRLDNWRTTTARFLREIHQLDPPKALPQSAGHPAYWQWCLLAAFGLLLLEFLVPSRQQI